jgi:prefoldin subunit 5
VHPPKDGTAISKERVLTRHRFRESTHEHRGKMRFCLIRDLHHSVTPDKVRKDNNHDIAILFSGKQTGMHDLSKGKGSEGLINAGTFSRPVLTLSQMDTREFEKTRDLQLSRSYQSDEQNLADKDASLWTGVKPIHIDHETSGKIQTAANDGVQTNDDRFASLDHFRGVLETESHQRLTRRETSLLGNNPDVSPPFLRSVGCGNQGHETLELRKQLAASILEIRKLKAENAFLKRHTDSPTSEKDSEPLEIGKQSDLEQALSDTVDSHFDYGKVLTIIQRNENDIEYANRPTRLLTLKDGHPNPTKVQNQDRHQCKNGNCNLEILSMSSDIDELQSSCYHLESEVLELTTKLTKCEEKLKTVEALAAAHFTGRLGLEARLQVAQKGWHEVSAELAFRKAVNDVLSIKTQVEIQAFQTETNRLQRALNESRQAKAKIDTNIAFLAGLELDDSDGEGDESSDTETLDVSRNSFKDSTNGAIECPTGKWTRIVNDVMEPDDASDEDQSDEEPIDETGMARTSSTVLMGDSKDSLSADQEVRDVGFEKEWSQSNCITSVPGGNCG